MAGGLVHAACRVDVSTWHAVRPSFSCQDGSLLVVVAGRCVGQDVHASVSPAACAKEEDDVR